MRAFVVVTGIVSKLPKKRLQGATLQFVATTLDERHRLRRLADLALLVRK